MKEGTIKDGLVLNYRDGFGTTTTNVIGQLRGGDKVIGTIDPTTNWFVVDHLVISGQAVNTAVQAYCSAYAGYYLQIVDYVPPAPVGLPAKLWIGTSAENVQEYRKAA